MDVLARVIFPFPQAVEFTLFVYFVLIGAGLIWWTGSLLWGFAVGLCAALAWIVDRWML